MKTSAKTISDFFFYYHFFSLKALGHAMNLTGTYICRWAYNSHAWCMFAHAAPPTPTHTPTSYPISFEGNQTMYTATTTTLPQHTQTHNHLVKPSILQHHKACATETLLWIFCPCSRWYESRRPCRYPSVFRRQPPAHPHHAPPTCSSAGLGSAAPDLSCLEEGGTNESQSPSQS